MECGTKASAADPLNLSPGIVLLVPQMLNGIWRLSFLLAVLLKIIPLGFGLVLVLKCSLQAALLWDRTTQTPLDLHH